MIFELVCEKQEVEAGETVRIIRVRIISDCTKYPVFGKLF
jgi:hypothetical protein